MSENAQRRSFSVSFEISLLVMFSPNLMCLIDLYGSVWVPGTVLQRSAAGGITLAVGCATCSS